MNNTNFKSYFEIIDEQINDFRKIIPKQITLPETEKEKFNKYSGDIKLCPRCKRKLPKNTYFYASGGTKRCDRLHGICKECEGTSFGWGRNKNEELQKQGLKYCNKCDRILPLNDIYFSKNSGRCNQKTGFSSNCKECNGLQFGIRNINDYKESLQIKEGYKVCNNCFKELPDNEDYFYKKSGRLNGSTICKRCLSLKENREYSKPHLNMSKKHNL